MKIATLVLAVLTSVLGYRVLVLEQEVRQLQTDAAITALHAEATNSMVGAIAPFFSQDKEAFARTWFDSANLPPAVHPDQVILPIKRSLDEKRSSNESRALTASILG